MTDIEHRQGCPATGGYGHGVEPCICGADTAPTLLPLPEPNGSYTNPYDGDDLENYARANMEPLLAEIETLRDALDYLRQMQGVPNDQEGKDG